MYLKAMIIWPGGHQM